MSEEIVQPVKRGPGRPPKAKVEAAPAATPPHHRMKAKPNWEDINFSMDDGSPDRLRVAPELVPEGMSLQWVTDSVYGQPQPQHRADFEKKGWTPIHQEDFDGAFDGLFMPRGAPGEIKLDGMVLMARPEELTKRARLLDKRRADEQVFIKEQALRGGDLQTTLDSHDPSALKSNFIKKSMERIEVPKDR